MTSDRRILELDGMRGLAAGAVVLFHYFYDSRPDGTLKWLLGLGWTGVDLFFVLSGFLIVGILLDVRDSPNFFTTFYYRRALRILPIYYLLVAIVFFGLTFFVRSYYGDPPIAWVYLLFLQNFWSFKTGVLPPEPLTVTWSLGIEEISYLLLPLIVRVAPRKILVFALAAGVVLLPVVRLILVMGNLTNPMIAGFITRFDPLLMGALCAVLVRSKPKSNWLVEARSLHRAALLVLGIAFLVFMSLRNIVPARQLNIVMNSFGYSLVGCFFSMTLLYAVLRPSSRLSALFRNKFLRAIGQISYGLYLYHQLVWFDLSRAFARIVGPVEAVHLELRFAAIALTLLVSLASFHIIEAPLIRRGHRMQYRVPLDDGLAK